MSVFPVRASAHMLLASVHLFAPGVHGAVAVAEGPWQFTADAWKRGQYEWKDISPAIAPSVTDWRGYDRLSVDLVNDGEGGDRLYVFISSPQTPHSCKFTASTATPGHRFKRWIVPLSGFSDDVHPSNITSIAFSSQRGAHQRLTISNIRLLEKGEQSGGGTFSEAPADNSAMVALVRRIAASRAEARAAVHAHALERFADDCVRAGAEQQGVLFGQASSMVRVMPRDDFSATPARALEVRLARNEKESIQLVVAAARSDISVACVEASDLVDGHGNIFSSTNIACNVMGYCELQRAPDYSYWETERASPSNTLLRVSRPPLLGWYPEPILDFLGKADVRKGDVQSFWLRVKCPSGQPAGRYCGKVRFSCRLAGESHVVREIPFSVRVYGFTLPLLPPVPMSISFKPSTRGPLLDADGIQESYEESERRIRNDRGNSARLARLQTSEWSDFLADNLITIDYLYPSVAPRWDELLRLKRQGRLGRFNLCYWHHKADVTPGSAFMSRVRERYAKARELGLLDYAVLYGMDEIRPPHFESGGRVIAQLKKEFPGIPLVTTAVDPSYGCDSALGGIDVFVPLTVCYRPDQVALARAQGRKVGWYVCAGGDEGVPQFYFAHQPIECRHLMGAMAVKYRPDWFLYYEIAIWGSDRPIVSGPFTDWSPESFQTWSGDGNLTACGPGGRPLSTVRLENFRDGLEDFHYAKMLDALVTDNPCAEWVAEAKRLLAVPDSIAKSLHAFTDNAAAYQSWRDAMAELLERYSAKEERRY